ncbi:MAG: hypothetical protein J7L26_12625 [Candidatus Aminicenantes bacterium]|nr:hypothetical protein [Candidatus Aminicenantes bacterium]
MENIEKILLIENGEFYNLCVKKALLFESWNQLQKFLEKLDEKAKMKTKGLLKLEFYEQIYEK